MHEVKQQKKGPISDNPKTEKSGGKEKWGCTKKEENMGMIDKGEMNMHGKDLENE